MPLVNWLQEKYGFVQVPRTLAELNLQTGVNFFHGYYEGRVIDKFSIYNNGVLLEAKQDTSYGDRFLDEVLSLAASQFDIHTAQIGRAYLSQVEVHLPISVGAAFEKFSEIGKMISNFLKQYNLPQAEDYQFSGMKMHYDQTGRQPPNPSDFIFERRSAEPYANNVYFSSAPLRTVDHLQVLEVFEQTLISVSGAS